MTKTNLSLFISNYIRENGITVNELARHSKIAHSTLDRWIAGTSTPSLKQLDVLARYTKTDLCYLVELIYPQSRGGVSPDVTRLAESIGKLPVEGKEMIDAIILGLSLKRNT